MNRHHRAHHRAVALLGAGTLLSLLLGCGVGLDDAPRALEVEASTTAVSTTVASGSATGVLYYVLEGSLVPYSEPVTDRRPESLLTALATPPSRLGAALKSSIPAGTEVLSTEVQDGRLTIDLSSDFDDVVGLLRQQAIGQMVLTVTGQTVLTAAGQSRIEQVAFRVDGEPITVSSPERGDTTSVGACDFEELLASPGAAGLNGKSNELLGDRIGALATECS